MKYDLLVDFGKKRKGSANRAPKLYSVNLEAYNEAVENILNHSIGYLKLLV